MKYQRKAVIIPQDKRAAYNEKILAVVNSGQALLTQEDIFNAYTGVGGLHGLKRSEFANYYQFAEAKKSVENGQFFTPDDLTRFVTRLVPASNKDIVLDPTSGMGNFANYAPIESNFYGCELDPNAHAIAAHLYPEAKLSNTDLRSYTPQQKATIVWGNPPFNLQWSGRPSQLVFCERVAEFLVPGGWLAMIVPSNFLKDDFWQKMQLELINEHFDFICQVAIPSNAFKTMGVDNFDTKVVVLQKRCELFIHRPFEVDSVITGMDLNDDTADVLYESYVKPRMDQFANRRIQLMMQGKKESAEFMYKARKMLFHIERNPKLAAHSASAVAIVDQYLNQKQPSGMEWSEWKEIMLTPEKVFAELNRILAINTQKVRQKIALVKGKHCAYYKAYSPEKQAELDARGGPKKADLTEMLVSRSFPFRQSKMANPVRSWFEKKLDLFDIQRQPFAEMEPCPEIGEWLDSYETYHMERKVMIQPNDVQKLDINLVLQKHYAILQWQTGAGKSLAALAYAQHRMEHTNSRFAFFVSTAKSVREMWMTTYDLPWRLIERKQDLDLIQPGDYPIVSYSMLPKLYKHIKAFLKKHSYRYTLVCDEVDRLLNMDAKCSAAAMACFHRAPYKLLATATTTRNNITDLYSMLWLLFNGSSQFLSESMQIHRQPRTKAEREATIEGGLFTEPNEYWNKPYPAYKKGFELFQGSHNPFKATVFGIGKNTQDVLSGAALHRLMRSTILTKTFEQITGRKPVQMHQEPCRMEESEKDFYKDAIEKFATLPYWEPSGEPRKDAMMKILAQLKLLLNICARPSTFPEVKCDMPGKYQKVLDLVNRFSDQHIAIGCRGITEVHTYVAMLRKHTDRPILWATGAETSIEERGRIVKELEATTNGILVSTQQAYSESINIRFVDKIIIPSLAWNLPSLEQYFGRFCRYDSISHDKDVYFVVYENSIEINVLGLIMAKERLNQFARDNEMDDDEMRDWFGVDYDLESVALHREYDSEGKMYIRWGEQSINM